MNCSSANGRSAGKCGCCPVKVFVPQIRAWVEESNKLACVRICSSYVRTFVPVTVQSGESEVLKNSQPAMLACNDVIDMKR